jgi:hypothetical protein
LQTDISKRPFLDAHSIDPVERSNEVHFGGAGIAETDLNTRGDERP